MTLKRKYLLFSLIVFVNIIIKSLYAGYASFSYDEMISIKNTLLDFGHIKHEAEWDNNPPFYYYCLWVWHKIFAVSEFNSRFLSVLFVSFSIGLAFSFAQKHFNAKTAFFCSILLSLSNFLMYYSQEARTYSLILLLVMLSSIQFFKFINKPTVFNIFILSIINFLIIYSHYISTIVVLAQYLLILVYFRKYVKLFFILQSAVILILVLFRFTKKQYLHIIGFDTKNDFWLQTASFQDLVNAISSLFYNKIIAIIMLIVLFFFCLSYNKNKSEDPMKVQVYCLFLGFLSILLLFITGTIKPVFLDRYLIFSIPFSTILVSFHLSRFKIYGDIVFITIALIQLIDYDLSKRTTMDYRSVVDIVKRFKKDQDYVIINTKDNLGLFEYYYDREQFLKYKNLDSVCGTQNVYGVNKTEALRNLDFKSGSHVFLIQSFHTINTQRNVVAEFLSNKMEKSYHTNFYSGVEFHIFKN